MDYLKGGEEKVEGNGGRLESETMSPTAATSLTRNLLSLIDKSVRLYRLNESTIVEIY